MSSNGQKPDPRPVSGFDQNALWTRGIGFLLIALTFLIFWPVANHEYIHLDDPLFVTANQQVLRGLTWDGVRWAFRPGHGDYWHPITWLSLMLDVTLFGKGARGLHLMNVALHAANAALVFALLKKWTGSLWSSAIVAAFFAFHPLRVESVAWVTERKDVLSTLFALLTLWAYGQYVKVRGAAPEAGNPQSAIRPARAGQCAYALALLFFGLGLMSKAMIVTLPFVMLLLDYWPFARISNFKFRVSNSKDPSTINHQPPVRHNAQRDGGSTIPRLLAEKFPFFVLSAISCLITFTTEQAGKDVVPTPDFSMLARLENATIAYAQYLQKTFCPINLSVHYPHPGAWSWTDILPATLLVGGLCFAACWWWRKWPWFFVGWFWFFGTLIPVIGLTKGWTQYIGDRFTYLPLTGLFIALVWGGAQVFAGKSPMRPWRAAIQVAVVALLLAASAVATRKQLGYWKNSELLFHHALDVTKNNHTAYHSLGDYYLANGRIDEALDCYQRVLAINPDSGSVYNNIGYILAGLGQTDAAMGYYENALRHAPGNYEAHNNIGVTLARKGRLTDAIEHYRKAIELNPDYADPHHNLANALARQGHWDEAIENYRAAIHINPDFAEPHFSLGAALARSGHPEEAIDHYRSALRINPNYAEAHFNLGRLLAATGHRDEAIVHLQEALRLKPDYSEAQHLFQDLQSPGSR